MARSPQKWTEAEDEALKAAMQDQPSESPDWNEVAARVQAATGKSTQLRNRKDCRKRWDNTVAGRCRKGRWTKEEDDRLQAAVNELGTRWHAVAERVATRQGDQCSKRWGQILNPARDVSPWTTSDDEKLLVCVDLHGHNWADISNSDFPTRTALDLKNRFKLLKRPPKTVRPSAAHRLAQQTGGNGVDDGLNNYQAECAPDLITNSSFSRHELSFDEIPSAVDSPARNQGLLDQNDLQNFSDYVVNTFPEDIDIDAWPSSSQDDSMVPTGGGGGGGDVIIDEDMLTQYNPMNISGERTAGGQVDSWQYMSANTPGDVHFSDASTKGSDSSTGILVESSKTGQDPSRRKTIQRPSANNNPGQSPEQVDGQGTPKGRQRFLIETECDPKELGELIANISPRVTFFNIRRLDE